MTDDIDFIAKHPEANMSNETDENRIRFNGKVYLAADKVLEIIYKLDVENMGFFPDWSHEYEAACKDFRTAVEALKEGTYAED